MWSRALRLSVLMEVMEPLSTILLPRRAIYLLSRRAFFWWMLVDIIWKGTTDTTRTFAMGELTYEEKHLYTAVCRGNLHLAHARFLHGCTGLNLDILCREPMWKLGLDFKHGTGHGVGYILNVHEGPNAFRWKQSPSPVQCGAGAWHGDHG